MTERVGCSQLINGLLFNISWLAIVALQNSAAALVVVALHLGLHFVFFSRQHREWLFICGVAGLGAGLDQLVFQLGLFNINGQTGFAPFWLSCLWPVLATTFAHAFKGLQTHLLLAAILGGIGGLFSYTAGTRMTDIDFSHAIYSPIIVTALWCLLFPALSRTSAIALQTKAEALHAT